MFTDRLDIHRFDPMRTRSDDAAVKEGFVWDRERALRVQEFIESLCRLSVGRWAAQPLVLMPWQQDYIYRCYGWLHRSTGLRRFRESYLEVAKKQGKSPLISALSLYHLVADGEDAPEVYINAASRDQASIVYREAARMRKQEPELEAILEEIPSQKRIIYEGKNGVLVANSAESGSKDGVQASFTIFDELHRQPDRELWDVFQYAGASREQPLLTSITTAGEPDPNHVCYHQHQRALRVENGSLTDVRFLGIVHGPKDENVDIDDRRVWRMANPSMGITISEDDFAKDLEKAKEGGPAALANFKRLRLNIWEKNVNKWVDMRVWHEQDPTRSDDEIEESGDVWAAGLDMSAGGDLTAYVRAAGNIKDGVDVRAHFWIPRDTAVKRQKEEGLPYLEWAEQGFVALMPGSSIDPLVIRDFILADAKRLNGKLKRIHSDFYNAREVGNGLIASGLDFQWMKQTPLDFHPSIKAIEALIARRKVRHDGNPVLTMCAGNTVCHETKQGNKILHKPSALERIDGMVGLAEAVAGLMDVVGYDGEAPQEPQYDEAPKMTWIKLNR